MLKKRWLVNRQLEAEIMQPLPRLFHRLLAEIGYRQGSTVNGVNQREPEDDPGTEQEEGSG